MVDQFEVIQIYINNGARFETYVIEEPAGSGTIGLYGAAAHLGKVGDLIIILSYGMMENKDAANVKIKVVRVDRNNKLVK